jgi:hypothetical protein
MNDCNFYTQNEVDSISDDFYFSAIKLVVSRTQTDRKVARYETISS